jgi:hypothetical protein
MRPGSGWTIAVLTTLAAGCREPTAAPRAPVPPHQVTPMVPAFNLVQDSTVLAESLLREVVVQLPESGSADSDLVANLWFPGELSGPVIIEVTGTFQLDAGTLPVTDALTSGALLWYEQSTVTAPPMRPPSGASPLRAGPLPGDVVVITLVRPVQLSFEALAPGDTAVRLGVDLAGPRDSARFVDTAAASHGMQLRWSYSDGNTSLGFPENLDSSCAVVGPFGCAPLPPRDSAHLSSGQPHGEVRVRVYRGRSKVVRIRSVTDTFSVPPDSPKGGLHTLQLLVDVLDEHDTPLLNRIVDLSVDGIERTGGHIHGGIMPSGVLSAHTVNTGASGVATLTYTANVFGGKVEVRATSSLAKTAVDTITVAFGGFVELLDAGNVDTIGVLAVHPDSHWGTSGMVSGLISLADSLNAKYKVKLRVNDMSLPLGGKFDLNAAYSPDGDHEEHRDGRSADVSVGGLDSTQVDFLRKKWQDLSPLPDSISVHDETKTRNHFHFRY